MIKKNSISIILILILVQAGLHAQDFRIEAPPGYNFVYQSDNLPKGVDGSPYLEDWQPAELQLKNGNVIPDLMMRYNVYTGQMLYKRDNEKYAIGTPDSISRIIFSDKTFLHKMFVVDDKVVQSYYEVIIDDKTSLYKKYEIIITPSNYNAALDVGNKNDKFTLREKMYLEQDGQLVEVDKKKRVLQVFSDKEKEISKYMKKEKLSHKDEDDMVKLVEFYNQIM